MKEFDWKAFQVGDVAVHCKTREEQADFCENADNQEGEWYIHTIRGVTEDVYLVAEELRVGYSAVEWSDYMDTNETKPQSTCTVNTDCLLYSDRFTPALPSIEVYKDGNQWCCIVGDLPTGVAGFGDTPKEAYIEFLKAWNEG